MADSSNAEGKTDLAATPARQGRYGRPVFWVLVASTLLAAIGLFAAWGMKAPALNRADQKVTETRAAHAADFNTPAPAPVIPPR